MGPAPCPRRTERLSRGRPWAPLKATPADVRDRIAPLMADAFGHTFWWALALLLLAGAAAFMLPRKKAEPIDDPDGAAGEPAEAPVLVGV